VADVAVNGVKNINTGPRRLFSSKGLLRFLKRRLASYFCEWEPEYDDFEEAKRTRIIKGDFMNTL
jgi:hypothetical protein